MNSRTINYLNIILTGLPRSGTSLTCHLLNKVENVIALNEPAIGINSVEEACDQITDFFINSRQSILHQKKAMSFHVNGVIPDNFFGEDKDTDGLRKKLEGGNRSLVEITKSLSDDFILCIKDNAPFAPILKGLTSYFPCYAIVRNPLAALASWNTVKAPVNKGHLLAAEKFDPTLLNQLSHTPDKIDRQLLLLSWFFNHYYNALPFNHIIRYEDIISSNGKCLNIITPAANALNEPLYNKNNNALYNKELMKALATKLLDTDDIYWEFYSKEDIQALAPD